ncbi:MAG: phosphoglucosamine mutase [Fidelibacterota bacterium]|nr:MAG: phosphoglucosamine mutase [Candidatus Neomarinimicrobiota bacterium]
MDLIRSVSGVRGVVGEGFDPQVVFRYAQAFAGLLPPGPVLLARDSRPHGRQLVSAAAQALHQAERQVIFADLAPTPTAQWITPRKHLAGAMVLTASHNPIEYNGLKFIGSDGCYLDGDQCDRLFELVDKTEIPREIPSGRIRSRLLFDAVGLHILDTINLSCIDTVAILRKRFKVVVDTVNGAASFALPTLLEALGCEVIRLHTTPDGTFPRGTEPLPGNLTDLCNAVTEHGADLGMATDPDADRLAVVDETGSAPGEELTQVLAVDGFLRRTGSRQPVTTNLSSSMLLDHVARRYGIGIHRSAVGEINVVELMRSVGGEIGGEGNGGVILAESHLGRDSLVGAALILDRLIQENLHLSTVLEELPQLHFVKDKVSADSTNADKVAHQITEHFHEAEAITLDGLKLQWPDRWIHIRQSNTEPVIRIYAEAPTENEAHGLVQDVRDVIKTVSPGAGS